MKSSIPLHEQNLKYLCKGVRVKRFRKPSKWSIQNRILMGILMLQDIKLSELAEQVRVSPRRVSAWVYEGSNPNAEHRAAIAFLTGFPQDVLFYDDQNYDKVLLPDAPKFSRKVLLSKIEMPVLCGLFMSHDFATGYVCKHIGIPDYVLKELMHRSKMPKEEHLEKLVNFFQLPKEKLLYPLFQ